MISEGEFANLLAQLEDLRDEVERLRSIAIEIEAAVASERERCAGIADDYDMHDGDFTARDIAKKIRGA